MKSATVFSKRTGLKLTVVAIAFLTLAGFAWSERGNLPERVEGSSMTEADIETAADPEKARAAFIEAA